MYWTIRDELSVSDGVVYKGMKPVGPVRQQTPETVDARPGRSQEAPPGPSAPANYPMSPAGFVTRSGRVSKPPRRLDL